MIWRKANEEFKLKNLKPTTTHGGGSLIVWDCISSKGVGELIFIDGILDKNKYLSILKDNLIKSANNMNVRDSFKFYQDNDPKHNKSRIVQEYLLYNCPKILHLPLESDLNPIENLWNLLDRNIRIMPTRSKEELKLRLKEEWTRITPDYLTKIISNMSKYLQLVIKQKDYPTKY